MISRLSTVRAFIPWWAWIVLLVAAEALIVIVGFPVSWSASVGHGDGAEYQRYAFNLLHHGVFSETPSGPVHPGVVRSPGYPAFLAALEWIGGRHVQVIQGAQFALVAASSVLVGFIARAFARPLIANLAAVLCAVYLPLLGFATVFLTETLTVFLLAAVVLVLIHARRSGTVRAYAALGLLLALATYVRPDSALIAVPILLVVVFDRRFRGAAARLAPAAALVAALIIPLVPWLIRDASVTGGRFIPMEADGGVSFLASADQYDGVMSEGMSDVKVWNAQVGRISGVPAAATEGIQAPVKYATARTQVKVNDEEQSAAVKAFKALSIATVIRHLPSRIAALWSVGDENPPPKAGSAWHHLAQLQYILYALLGVLGLALRRRRLLTEWPLWFIGATLTVGHLVFPVEARYTLLARPTLMIYAAAGALAVVSVLTRRRLPDVTWQAAGVERA